MAYKELEDYCHQCGKLLERGWNQMTYHDSRFCCDACRTKYHNARKKLKAQKEKMLEFIGFLHESMKKGGELAVDAGLVNDMIYELSRQKSGVKILCKQCGQQRMTKPRPGDKCSFCGDSDWQFGDSKPGL
jgi:hypothetical protein